MHTLFMLFLGITIGIWVSFKLLKMGQTVERGTISVRHADFDPRG